MRKREIAAALGIAVTMTGCAAYEINQIKTNDTIELGSTYTPNYNDYFELGKRVKTTDITVDTSSIDVNAVGNYDVVFTYNNDSYKVNLSVVDSTSPVLTLKDNVDSVERGSEIKASDYAEASDLSSCKVYFSFDGEEKDSLQIPLDYDADNDNYICKLVAIDDSQNRSETKEITIPLVAVAKYIIEPIDDTTMYALQELNVRSQPYTDDDSKVVNTLKKDDEIIVNGKVNYDNSLWYIIKSDSKEKQFVNSKLITTGKPVDQKQSGGNNGSSSTTKPSGGNSGQQSGGSSGENPSSGNDVYCPPVEGMGDGDTSCIGMSDCISF